MATATFTEQGRRYEADGVIIPSVTQVLTLAGISDVSGIPAHILDRASAIGTAVHQACEFLDQNDLDLDTLDASIVGYVLGYQKFRDEHKFVSELIEHRTVAERIGLKYGMCVDRMGHFEGSDIPVVLDIKTSSRPQQSWSLQTAAYAYGLGYFPDYRRVIVHVAKDGTYKLIEHGEESDDRAWEAALIVAHWRIAHGTKIK